MIPAPRPFALVLSALLLATSLALADGPADNQIEDVRRIPKLGVEVPAEKRAELEAGLKELRGKIDDLRKRNNPKINELLPDLEIFHKAVNDALVYQEFFDPKDVDFAPKLITAGLERASALAKGEAPWTTEKGLVVRGFVSKLDGSVQPYGLVVPDSFNGTGNRHRCDIWLHGRGETLSELNFLRDRMTNIGTMSPRDVIVLHPYGRYSNAFKFAGEVDVFESLASVQKRYPIDADRIAMRGFSMGGAGAWHLAVHHPDRWFAANPGAGFSETPDFLRVFQKQDLKPLWWEKTLWQWYDCPAWVNNLRGLPTVAYSGELDSQKQAADIMEAAMQAAGMQLRHVIAPETKHAYSPDAKEEVDRRLAALEQFAGNEGNTTVSFTTLTLRYPKHTFVTIDELEEHWKPGTIEIDIGGEVRFSAKGITAFTVDSLPGYYVDQEGLEVIVNEGLPGAPADDLNSEEYSLGTVPALSDRSIKLSAHKIGDRWHLGPRTNEIGLRKKHGLTGPIDDAFMDSFLFVAPTGKAWNELPAQWSTSELTRAKEHWRRHFRGVPRVKNDSQMTPDDLARHNLVLWGDPGSNAVLAQIAAKLPIKWTAEQVQVGGASFPANQHAVVAIYPNPLNPKKYVVLNSSFTFREFAYLNNARQVPMLPDWAVVDLSTPPNSVWPGKIVAADFFDERWQLKPLRPVTSRP
ncbi:alpha/beta hydrolase-fold protein [Anatilimnocola sp. NA78]|uniref:alpha/beta hydrolase-fold protein n=1 Tax=Anatilimnocola sp. NA78 TaxID=3415683 RepID=UPI003CE4C117